MRTVPDTKAKASAAQAEQTGSKPSPDTDIRIGGISVKEPVIVEGRPSIAPPTEILLVPKEVPSCANNDDIVSKPAAIANPLLASQDDVAPREVYAEVAKLSTVAKTQRVSPLIRDPLTALLSEKSQKKTVEVHQAVEALGFCPGRGWVTGRDSQPLAAASFAQAAGHVPAVGSTALPASGDPLSLHKEQKTLATNHLDDVAASLSRSSLSMSKPQQVRSSDGPHSSDVGPTVAVVRHPASDEAPGIGTSLQDFLGELVDDMAPVAAREDDEDDALAFALRQLRPSEGAPRERWVEQTREADNGRTLFIGPLGPAHKCDIIAAWYGSEGHQVDVRNIVCRLVQECKTDTLTISAGDLGEAVLNKMPETDLLASTSLQRSILSVRFRVWVGSHEVSTGKFKEGMGRMVPMVTKALANVVGATLAASGYAVAKAEMQVKNKLLAPGAGSSNDVADSEVFQMGFQAWLSLNGIKPSITYEPLGNTGSRLLWIYSQNAGAGEVPRGIAPPEDMKQTPLLIANHISYIDALVLAAMFGAPKVIARSGTLNTPLIGTFAKEIGVIEVDRDSRESRAATLDSIAGHVSSWKLGDRPLMLFPEGTTSNGLELLQFKKGAFVAGVPVRPVVLCYTGAWHPANTYFKVARDGEIEPTSEREWYEQFLGHFIHSLAVKVLPPYIPNEEEKADPAVYAKHVRSVMATAYTKLRQEAEAKAMREERTKSSGPLERLGSMIKEGAKGTIKAAHIAATSTSLHS